MTALLIPISINLSTTQQLTRIKMKTPKGYKSNDSASFNENDGAMFDEQREPQEYTPKNER